MNIGLKWVNKVMQELRVKILLVFCISFHVRIFAGCFCCECISRETCDDICIRNMYI